jgi:hypothetical protein
MVPVSQLHAARRSRPSIAIIELYRDETEVKSCGLTFTLREGNMNLMNRFFKQLTDVITRFFGGSFELSLVPVPVETRKRRK